jgi:hypothetical protein
MPDWPPSVVSDMNEKLADYSESISDSTECSLYHKAIETTHNNLKFNRNFHKKVDIRSVRDNLKNTIAGKKDFLAELSTKDDLVSSTTCNFLAINIAELERILADIESCCN